MREILFRGKCVDNDEWIEGIAFPHDNRGEVTMFRQHPADGSLIGDEVVSNTVGQYTGFKDCHKKKIFEGDILKISSQTNGSFLSIVIFDSDSFKVNILCLHNEFLSSQVLNLSTIFNEKFSVKIIGNIFDNDIKRLLNEVK